MIENGWSRIKTIEEAEKIAKAARSAKADKRASEFGRRGAKARWAKQSPVTDSGPTKNESPVMENAPTCSDGKHTDPSDGKRTEGAVSPVMVSTPLTNIFPGRGLRPANDTGGDVASTSANPTPRQAWSAPRFRELDPVTEEPIGPWNPLLSNAQDAGPEQLTVDASTPHASTSALVH